MDTSETGSICKINLMLGVAAFGLIQLLPPVFDSGSWPLYESCSLCGSWLSE